MGWLHVARAVTMSRLGALIVSLSACLALTAFGAEAEGAREVPAGQVRITPVVTITGDWLAARGGRRDASVFLAKPEARLTFEDDEHHAVVFDAGAINGQSIGALAGDAQGTSNLEGPRAVRVFDFFYETPLREFPGTLLRAGIIDLNAFFYVQGDAAAMFLNGSHGVGPEFSHSGRNGPSVFPNMGMAGMVEHPVPQGTVRIGVFDAAPNDPERPSRAALHLPGVRGALLVGEWDMGKARVGGWTYTSGAQPLNGTGSDRGDAGAYAIATFRPADSLASWLTAGVSNPRFNRIDSYLGGGTVQQLGRNSVGVAIASAGFAHSGRRETALEFSALIDLTGGFSLQPDLQYVRHPSGGAGGAWVAGVRIRYSYNGSESPSPILLRGARLRPLPAAGEP